MSAGKGDKRRPFDQQKWDENYDRIFKNNKLLNESEKQEDIKLNHLKKCEVYSLQQGKEYIL